MIRYCSVFVLMLLWQLPGFAQKAAPILLNKELVGHLEQKDSVMFRMALKKDNYYSIVVMQKGIDLVVIFKGRKGKILRQQDSPNGRYGPEKIDISPDESGNFFLLIKPLPDSSNSMAGDYTVVIKEAPKSLQHFSKEALLEDLAVLKNGLIETHVGLWYNTYLQLDSMCNAQKNKIRNQMTSLEFYRIMAPVLGFVKEGHANLKPSDEAGFYLNQHAKLFPFFIKVLDKKIYVINDLDHFKAKGKLLTKINGKSIDSILQLFLSAEPSDGYNETSKYRWVETAFSRYYQRFFETADFFSVELADPASNAITTYNNIQAVSLKQYNLLRKKLATDIPAYQFKETFLFSIDSEAGTAILTVNSFSTSNYEGGRKEFKKLLEQAFQKIRDQQIKALVIDIRKNEGGAQGMEDHLLSYLTDKKTPKYKYVELPGFDYAFLPFTDYKDSASQKELKDDLADYFYRSMDGRFLDKPGKYSSDEPAANNFKGELYILIGGLTFSGGSEFAALAKNYTKAIFIGEETGGGYYGNTSGEFLQFVLPYSGLKGRLPLFKFVLEPKENNIPFGHGVLPDHYLQPTIEQYLDGYDAELEFAKKMINK